MSADVSQSNYRPHRNSPRWHGIALLGAGFQCLVWGIFIILWPVSSSLAYGFAQPPVELFLWQGTGLVIVLFGIGYVVASTNPPQHWLIVLIGLLGKSLGPVGMAWSAYHGQVSSRVLYLIPINDLVWLVPFGLILVEVRRSRR